MDEQRTRPAPRERFADPAMRFDLERELSDLREEEASSVHGHRQKALIKRNGHTVALFSFEKGGELSEHSANGYVTLHGLEGRLRVSVAGEETVLAPGSLVVMNPNTPHNVRAEERGAMLLHVSLSPRS